MDVPSYFRSLSLELRGLQSRVRQMIADRHWQTDGEWKESVVRCFLQRNVPRNVAIGRGFVVGERGASSQVDVLLYDRDAPVLFQDGDLVFITPDALRGMIEVKSSVDTAKFREALANMLHNIKLFGLPGRSTRFFGVFSFESTVSTDSALEALRDSAAGNSNCYLDLACLGYSHFIKWWHSNPEVPNRVVKRWHSYRLPEMAPGYFLHNVVAELAGHSVHENSHAWFPAEGKEVGRDGMLDLTPPAGGAPLP
jgi:hypothetical protein